MTKKERLDRLEAMVLKLAETVATLARMSGSEYYIEKEPNEIIEELSEDEKAHSGYANPRGCS